MKAASSVHIAAVAIPCRADVFPQVRQFAQTHGSPRLEHALRFEGHCEDGQLVEQEQGRSLGRYSRAVKRGTGPCALYDVAPRWLDPFDVGLFLRGMPRLQRLAAALNVEPETGAVAEHSRQGQCRRCRHVAPVVIRIIQIRALSICHQSRLKVQVGFAERWTPSRSKQLNLAIADQASCANASPTRLLNKRTTGTSCATFQV